MQELEEMAQGGPRQYLNSPFLLEGGQVPCSYTSFSGLGPTSRGLDLVATLRWIIIIVLKWLTLSINFWSLAVNAALSRGVVAPQRSPLKIKH